MTEPHLAGLLLVDKPGGMTSFDVVRRVRALLGIRKIGHTGTLDPFATGVLPLCLGPATRLAGFLSADDKVYEATMVLGVTTDTLDLDGRVLSRTPVDPLLTEETLADVFVRFTGPIEQTPPMYSAVKVNGKRLHRYAREGKTVSRPPRRVVVHAFDLVSLSLPRVTFRVRCSKGTYVRVLAADVGDVLGVGAHLEGLRRVKTGPFDVSNALTLDEIETLSIQGKLQDRVVPLRGMLPHFPAIEVDQAAVVKIAHGNRVSRLVDISDGDAPWLGRRVRLCRGHALLAVGEVVGVESRQPLVRLEIQPRIVLTKN